MLVSFFHISFEFSRSMMLKAIWLLTPSRIIHWAIPIVICSLLAFFENKVGFWRLGLRSVNTRSHISFLISINFVIIDYISQLAKLVSFLHLVWLPKVLFSTIIAMGIRGGGKSGSTFFVKVEIRISINGYFYLVY